MEEILTQLKKLKNQGDVTLAKQKKSIQDNEEREYIVPLRRKWINTPKYRRAEKAVKSLKQFLAKHLRVEDRNIKKIKLDHFLNEEIWYRGIKKPLHKVKVKVKKEGEIFRVFLSEIPQVVKYRMDKEKKIKESVEKIKEKKKEETKSIEETEPEKTEKKEEIEEKKESVKEEMQQMEKQIHKQIKHEQTSKKPPKVKRMALQK